MLAKKYFLPIVMILSVIFFAPMSDAEKLPMATGEWVPFTSASMKDYGQFTKRVSIVCKEMGVEPEFIFYPWPRCFDSVEKGRVWAAFPYSYTKKRAQRVWFSDMLSCSKTVFFYYSRGKPPREYRFDSLKDLKRYKIGGVSGYFYEESFKKAGLQVDYVNKEINGMEKLKLGRIDLMPVNDLVGWNLVKTKFPADAANFKTLARPLSVDPLRLIISKDFPGSKILFDRFNRALRRCIDKGLIKIEKCQ